MTGKDLLENNVLQVKRNIEEACAGSGARPDEIIIVAATKTVGIDRINPLSSLGINICGENRAQELVEKYGKADTRWHFIGRLQTNKVKYIIDKVELIHSLDRIELASEIQRQCEKYGLTMDCLIEVNIGEEPNKGGIQKQDLDGFYVKVSQSYPNIRICGLMTVMPIGAGEKYYLQMRDIYDKMKARYPGIKYLSMGMSDDYITAIRHGANMVRLGRALFGERIYG